MFLPLDIAKLAVTLRFLSLRGLAAYSILAYLTAQCPLYICRGVLVFRTDLHQFSPLPLDKSIKVNVSEIQSDTCMQMISLSCAKM